MSGGGAQAGRASGAAGEITIVLVSWHSAADLAHLVQNLRARATRPDRLRYLIIDNTNGSDPELSALAADDLRLMPVDAGRRRGSWAHAFALDRAMEQIETGLVLISDPDVHVFRSGWDAMMVRELRERGALAIGAPYPWWKLGKYHDFPSPVFMLFDFDRARRLGIDWTPFPAPLPRRLYDLAARQVVRLGFLATRRRLLASTALARTARRLETTFGVIGPDTGYRFARAARGAGQRATLFAEATAKDPRLADRPAARELATDFELYLHDDKPMIAHRYSTRSWLWRTARGDDAGHFLICIQRLEAENSA